MDNEELLLINSKYEKQLKSLDVKTKAMIAYFLLYVSKNVLQGDYNATKQKLLNNAIGSLKTSLLALIQENIQLAIEVSQQLVDVQLRGFKSEVERLFVAKKIKVPSDLEFVAKLTEADKQKAIDSVINKKWPDNLKVTDRIDRLGKKIKQITEDTIIQGRSAELSPDDLTDQLRSRFIDGGIEQRGMLRLIVHTTNMVKEKIFANIADQNSAIAGIHVMRGAGGSVKCPICLEHAGEVGGPGVKYYKEYGDNLGIMADLPPYHSYCKCVEELIFKSASEFIDERND